MAMTKKAKVWLVIGGVVCVLAVIGSISKNNQEAADKAAYDALPQATKDSLAAVEAKRDSIEKAKERDKKVAGKESTAYVMAKEYVLKNIKYPKTADFPITPIRVLYVEGGTYNVAGSVECENAFGVPSEHKWFATMHYNGGDQFSDASWSCSYVSINE